MKLISNSFWIVIGTFTPAVLSIFFILNFAVDTIFLDEWEIVPFLPSIFDGTLFSLNLGSPQNDHIPIFPRLFILGIVSVSSYNIFLELMVGWIFLSATIFVLWRLLLRTIPDLQLLIIPISWLSYSFVQYENFLWGWSSIFWHLPIFFIISAIYFLNRASESPKFFLFYVGLCVIATFSHLIGLVTWLIGFYYFRTIKTRYFIILPILFVVTIFSYFELLENNENIQHRIDTNLNEPIKLIKYVFVYLGNSLRISGDFNEQVPFSLAIGIIFFLIFLAGIVFHIFMDKSRIKSDIRPWFDISLFSLLAAMVTGFGRIEFGVYQALSNRYIVVSNLFLDGIIIITGLIFLNIIKNEKNPTRRRVVKVVFVIFLALLVLYILGSYVSGWVGASIWNEKLSKGNNCLINYESSSEECLRILYPNVEILKSRITILEKLCLPPFDVNCIP